MANDSQLRAGEIKDVLLNEIERYEDELQAEEIGEVLEVKDGIARIYGLTKAMASEMLEITSSDSGETVTALALNLEEDNIGAVIMGEWTSLHEGDQVRRTGRVLDISVGAGYLAVNVSLGNLLEPRLMGQSLGLSTLVVFLSLLAWGGIWGPAGMLLSVPMTVILKLILEVDERTRWIAILLGRGADMAAESAASPGPVAPEAPLRAS